MPIGDGLPGAPILTFPRRGEPFDAAQDARGGGAEGGNGNGWVGWGVGMGRMGWFGGNGNGWVGLGGPSTRLRMNGKRAPLVGAPSFGAGVSGSGLWVGALAFLGSAAHYVDACGGYYGHYGYYQGYDG